MNLSIDIPNWAFVTIVVIWTAYVVLSFVDRYLKYRIDKIKMSGKWVSVDNDLPEIGQSITVQTTSGQIFYAIYSGDDEFDVHRPEFNINNYQYRSHWYKHSGRTVVRWRPLSPA